MINGCDFQSKMKNIATVKLISMPEIALKSMKTYTFSSGVHQTSCDDRQKD